jgi:hypothetical protein
MLLAVAAPGQGRPTPADLAACEEYARAQVGVLPYVERAPTSPLPSRVSGVAPWSGPIVSTPAPPSLAPSLADLAIHPASGVFGAGGSSQEAGSTPGPTDVRAKEAFDACLRARGF